MTIKELAEIVQKTVGFSGEIVRDTSKPDGTLRKLVDTSMINTLVWLPNIELETGNATT